MSTMELVNFVSKAPASGLLIVGRKGLGMSRMPMHVNVGVIGSRHFADMSFARAKMFSKLTELLKIMQAMGFQVTIGSGGCPVGVDDWVYEYCQENKHDYVEFPPKCQKCGTPVKDLERDGKLLQVITCSKCGNENVKPQAYHIRNQKIVKWANQMIIFWNGNKVRSGTFSVIRRCQDMKLRRRDEHMRPLKIVVFRITILKHIERVVEYET